MRKTEGSRCFLLHSMWAKEKKTTNQAAEKQKKRSIFIISTDDVNDFFHNKNTKNAIEKHKISKQISIWLKWIERLTTFMHNPTISFVCHLWEWMCCCYYWFLLFLFFFLLNAFASHIHFHFHFHFIIIDNLCLLEWNFT